MMWWWEEGSVRIIQSGGCPQLTPSSNSALSMRPPAAKDRIIICGRERETTMERVCFGRNWVHSTHAQENKATDGTVGG